MITVEQAKELIKLARDAISDHLSRKTLKVSSSLKKKYPDKMGVFVTLKKGGHLRGCIGIPEAIYPLHEGIVNAALSAAFSDPRFPPLDKEEFKTLTIEISLLSRPTVIEVRSPKDYIKHIRIGKDGLLVRGVFQSGLLLPQVAVEQKWDAKTFLEQTCVKAGLPKDTWTDFEACNVLKFEGSVFSEQTPQGKVVKIL
jgi:uncharacterized protein (TIGR00296 family)